MKEIEPWTSQDESNYLALKSRYSDRKHLGDEMIAKRKTLKDMPADNQLYQRASVAADMAAMRFDMSYIIAENEKMREMAGTISWLHEQLSIVQGAYAHTKMLAEMSKINYSAIHKGLKQISQLTEELTNGTEQRSKGIDGAKS